MANQLVGISVSFCVQEICEGKVELKDVKFIVPGFDVVQLPEQIFENYKDIYWKKFPNALYVLKQLQLKYVDYEVRRKLSSYRSHNQVWITEEEFNECFEGGSITFKTEDVVF